ncbi:MAG TPA: hypothetical protein VFS21_30990 [Roseiflexaceae bacterium]|nr:hypothetical protein [Roseiflexaceae bacterium]
MRAEVKMQSTDDMALYLMGLLLGAICGATYGYSKGFFRFKRTQSVIIGSLFYAIVFSNALKRLVDFNTAAFAGMLIFLLLGLVHSKYVGDSSIEVWQKQSFMMFIGMVAGYEYMKIPLSLLLSVVICIVLFVTSARLREWSVRSKLDLLVMVFLMILWSWVMFERVSSW